MKTNKILKERVQKYVENHPDASLIKIVDNSAEIGCSRWSVYRWANSALQNRKVGWSLRLRRPVRIAINQNVYLRPRQPENWEVPVVPKDINPANAPKARPIEDFLGNFKALVYKF